MTNKPKWVVIVCCQGEPHYYFYPDLESAVKGLNEKYNKLNKYGTCRFELKQVFDVDKEYKIREREQK